MLNTLKASWDTAKKPLWILITVAVVTFLTVPLLNAAFIWALHRFLLFKSSSGLPSVNPYLLSSIISFILLVWIGVPTLLQGLKRSTAPSLVRRWVLMALGISLLWNAALGIVRNDHLFGPDGRSARFFSLRPNGEVYLAYHPGVDPVYGTKLHKVTPEIVDSIRHWRSGPPERLSDEPVSFFDTATGQPQVWVSPNSDGTWSFFDGPGFDDHTATALTPVTSEWVAAYRVQQAKQKDFQKAKALREKKIEQSRSSERLREDRAEEFRSQVDLGRIPANGESVVSLNVRGVQVPLESLTSSIQKHAGGDQLIEGVLRESFFDSKVCQDLLSSDWSRNDTLPKEWSRIKALVVLNAKLEFSSVELDKDLIRAEIVVNGDVYFSSGMRVTLPRIEGFGAGFSKAAAQDSAIENIAKAQAEEISKALHKAER
jgi:hypothetical protein